MRFPALPLSSRVNRGPAQDGTAENMTVPGDIAEPPGSPGPWASRPFRHINSRHPPGLSTGCGILLRAANTLSYIFPERSWSEFYQI